MKISKVADYAALRCVYKGLFVLITVSHLSKTHFTDTLFAFRVILVAVLLSADFPKINSFQRNL